MSENKSMNPMIDWNIGRIFLHENGYTEDGEQEKILLLGDLCPSGEVERFLIRHGMKRALGNLYEYAKNADLTIYNLEAPLIDKGSGISKAGPNIRASPQVAKILSEINPAVACLANNHVMDYGKSGLISTIDNLEKFDIKTCGASSSLQSSCQPLSVDLGRTRVEIHNVAEAEEASATVDRGGACTYQLWDEQSKSQSSDDSDACRIVLFHAGLEYVELPPPNLYFRVLRDLNEFPLIIGHHPHVPQGFMIRNNGVAAFSMGNLLFDPKHLGTHPLRFYGYALQLSVKNGKPMYMDILPYRVKDGTTIITLQDEKKAKFLKYLKKTTEQLRDLNHLEVFWKLKVAKFVESKEMSLLSARLFNSSARGSPMKLIQQVVFATLASLYRRKQHQKDAAILKNMISNESHRKFLVDVFTRLEES